LRRREEPTGGFLEALHSRLLNLETRLAAETSSRVRLEHRCAQLESELEVLAASASTSELAQAQEASDARLAALERSQPGGELRQLRLRLQALETSNDARGSDGFSDDLRPRVHELEQALGSVRDALKIAAESAAQWGARGRAADDRLSRHSRQLEELSGRCAGAEARLESAEMSLAAAAEAAQRAEETARASLRRAEGAQRAASEAATASALPRSELSGVVARVTALEAAVSAAQAEASACRLEWRGGKDGVDALALITETLMARLEALEGDVESALGTLARELAQEGRRVEARERAGRPVGGRAPMR
jgi:chromosome segregation ATPase